MTSYYARDKLFFGSALLWPNYRRNMENYLIRTFFLLLAIVAILSPALALSGEDELKLEAGETLLPDTDAEKVLSEITATFVSNPYIKARIVTEVDDLLAGIRKDEGELLLDRAGRVMRKFTKPALKVWLLNESQIQEYSARRKTVYIKDLSKAPKTLKLLQAAATGDVKGLGEIFALHVFRSEKDGQANFRLLLSKKLANESPVSYKHIQARILQKGLFFHEIEYVPEAGDHMIERYMGIESVTKPRDEEFTLDVPADVTRKIDVIQAQGETK